MFHTPSRCDDQTVTISPSYPAEDDVDNDVIRCLIFLLDGDVWVDHLDVDIRCLGCAHTLGDDAEVANDACITEALMSWCAGRMSSVCPYR